jgi:hypothetical protein
VSEEFFLLFDLEQNRVDLVPSLISSSIDGASVVLPLVPLIRDINHKLTADPLAGVQRILPFSAGRFQERQSG